MTSWMAELMRMCFDVGLAADASHDTSDEVPIEGSAVVDNQASMSTDVFEIVGGPCGQERDQVRVERDVAIVAELADRNT